jgi:hypothetical protein
MRLRILAGLLSLWAVPAQAATTVPPNDPNIVFSPGVWNPGASQAVFVSGGSWLKVAFTGTANITVGGYGGNRYQYRVDGDAGGWQSTATGLLVMPSASSSWKVHTLELVWADDGPQGVTEFTIDTGGSTVPWHRPAPVEAWAIGDSITDGVQVLGNTIDARHSWAYLLGNLLGFDIGMSGYIGAGYTVAGNNLAQYYPYLYATTPRNFSKLDLIIINMGVNDVGSVTAACISDVNGMLAGAKSTTWVILLRPFKDSTHTAELQACAAGANVTGTQKVVFVDTAGFQATAPGTLHPPGWDEMINIAPRIAAALRALHVGSEIPRLHR